MRKVFYLIFFISLATNTVKSAREMKGDNFGTHMSCLLTAVMNTDGPIIEVGSGDFSTPLLHALCRKDKRLLYSLESDKDWLNNFTDLTTDWHKLIYIPKWIDLDFSEIHWAVALIDNYPLPDGNQRAIAIERLRKNTDIFVMHDTQDADLWYPNNIISTFKYIYVDKRYNVQTTVASDTIDVTKF